MAAEEGKFIRTRRNQLDFPSRNCTFILLFGYLTFFGFIVDFGAQIWMKYVKFVTLHDLDLLFDLILLS